MADFKIKKSPNEGKVIAYYETETEYFSATGDNPIDAVEQLQFLLENEGIEIWQKKS